MKKIGFTKFWLFFKGAVCWEKNRLNCVSHFQIFKGFVKIFSFFIFLFSHLFFTSKWASMNVQDHSLRLVPFTHKTPIWFESKWIVCVQTCFILIHKSITNWDNLAKKNSEKLKKIRKIVKKSEEARKIQEKGSGTWENTGRGWKTQWIIYWKILENSVKNSENIQFFKVFHWVFQDIPIFLKFPSYLKFFQTEACTRVLHCEISQNY